MLVMMIAALASGHAALTTHAVALHVADANCTWPMTCPGTLPLMNQTWQMNLSTIIMPCNYTGLYDYDAYPQLAKFGLVDYDWSNAKKTWVDQSPMDCDGMLVQQAARNKAKNPSAKVFVYR